MTRTVPVWIDDPTNAAILAVSEDRLQGFQLDPFGEIAERSQVDVATVLERIVALLRSGTIRRVRQTLMATNLAPGALCAWQVPQERLDRGVRVAVRRGSVLRARRDPDDRRSDARLALPAVDDLKGSTGVFDRQARRVLGAPDRRASLSAHAGAPAVRARGRTRPPARDAPRRARRRARRRDRTERGRTERARMARADRAQTRVRARRDRARPVAPARGGGRRRPG